MKVERLMTKAVATCRPSDTLNEAARIMWERDCGCVPVTALDGSERVVGILTDRDVCMAAYIRGSTLAEIRAWDAMATTVETCRPDDDVRDAEAVMRRAQVHRLPVVDDAHQLLGLISLADIAREAGRTTRGKRREVDAAQVGQTLAAICQPRAAEPGAEE